MKKFKRKKGQTLDNNLCNITYRDESSSTIPILASSLSTSISIIDIDKFNYINGEGCQYNKEPFNQNQRQKTMFCTYEKNSSTFKCPKNMKIFQSQRIQVESNAFSKGDYLAYNRNYINFSHRRNTSHNANVTQFERNIIEKTQKKLAIKSYNNRRIKESYPNINIQLISMMLPNLYETLESNKMEHSKMHLLAEKITQHEEKANSENKNIGYKKRKSVEGKLEQKEMNMYEENKDVCIKLKNSVDKQTSVTDEDMRVLWKHALRENDEKFQTFFENFSKESNLSSEDTENEAESLITQQTCLPLSEKESLLHKKQKKYERNENNYSPIEQLYFNERVQEKQSNEERNKDKNEHILDNISYTSDVESYHWLPNLVKKVGTCYSFFKDILVEKKEYTFEHYRDFSENDRNETSSKEVCNKNKDIDTLFYKETYTGSSSTNFETNLQNINWIDPDLTLQNPYCRNYFVYFNQYQPPLFNSKNLNQIPKQETTLIKKENLVKQQFSCLKSVATAILFLTEMFSEFYENSQESIVSCTKCFSRVFSIQNLFEKAVNPSVSLSKTEGNLRNPEPIVELLYLDSMKQKEIFTDTLRINQSVPVCCKRSIQNSRSSLITDIDVGLINSDCVLVQWKVPETSMMLAKSYKVYLNDVLRCTLMYCETCVVLEEVDISEPLSITIKMYTVDGYCSCTKFKTRMQ